MKQLEGTGLVPRAADVTRVSLPKADCSSASLRSLHKPKHATVHFRVEQKLQSLLVLPEEEVRQLEGTGYHPIVDDVGGRLSMHHVGLMEDQRQSRDVRPELRSVEPEIRYFGGALIQIFTGGDKQLAGVRWKTAQQRPGVMVVAAPATGCQSEKKFPVRIDMMTVKLCALSAWRVPGRDGEEESLHKPVGAHPL